MGIEKYPNNGEIIKMIADDLSRLAGSGIALESAIHYSRISKKLLKILIIDSLKIRSLDLARCKNPVDHHHRCGQCGNYICILANDFCTICSGEFIASDICDDYYHQKEIKDGR